MTPTVSESVSSKVKRELGLFLGFLCTAVFFRFWTFFQSGLDWDESLYLLVSQSMLDGDIPYVGIWDNKPVGIYLLYILSFLLFGKSIFAIRLLSCGAIAATCYVLYHFSQLWAGNAKLMGVIAALLYIVSTLQNGGTAANTEIFFIPFVATAYYWVAAQWQERTQSVSRWRYFAIGLCLGIAFIIKYVVIYDLVAILLLLAVPFFLTPSHIAPLQSRHQYFQRAGVFLILLLGFLLPFFLMASFFVLTGSFSDFFYANFTANKIRNIDRNFSLRVVIEALVFQLRKNFPLWIGLALIWPALFKQISSTERRLSLIILVWILIPLLGVLLTFKVNFYDHYFLPLLPPLSLITAFFLVKLLGERNALSDRNPRRSNLPETSHAEPSPGWRITRSLARKYLPLLCAIALLIGFYAAADLQKSAKFFYFSYIKGVPHYQDKAAEVSAYLQPRIQPDNYIYVADYDPVVYFLSKAKIPTRYAYPFFLMGENLPKVAGANSMQELSALMQKRPLYVVMSARTKEEEHNRLFYSKLKAWLEQDYSLERLDNEVKLYRRKSSS
ncbi:MAG TPA: glycosyltransferase family 39 protein [Coleofasciculaceae cyanobacterium]|jgi:hypothetical protein